LGSLVYRAFDDGRAVAEENDSTFVSFRLNQIELDLAGRV
jgi:hypothetical protein